MNFLKNNWGWWTALLITGIACYFWGEYDPPKPPVISKPQIAKPVFIHDTTIIVKRLGGSIGIADNNQTPEGLAKIPTPQPNQETLKVCPPFTLHLVSADSSAQKVGLDSALADYFYPSGNYFFSYWPAQQKGSSNTLSHSNPLLSIGLSTYYHRYQNNLSGNIYVRLRISGLSLESGYHHQTKQQLGWFLGVRKEWVVF